MLSMKWTHVSCSMFSKPEDNILYVFYFLSNSPQNAVSTFVVNSPMKVEVVGLLGFLPLQACPVNGIEPGQGDQWTFLPSQRGIAQRGVEKDSRTSKHLSLPVEGSRGATENGEYTGAGLMFAFRPSTWHKSRLQLHFHPLLVIPPLCCEPSVFNTKDLSQNI